ncbi:MAG: hypothetical protein IJ834_06325 [Paludibacteraceae bacterium]|nr:hypothetical protein [Paludibacteraceae bacterium]
MKRLLIWVAALILSINLAANGIESPHFGKTDKGLFGGQVGKGRIYFDIVLPRITSNLLVDIGMSMSQVNGVIGMAPKWFAMFSPTACPYGELCTTPKSGSAIMITFRTYF